MTDFERKKAIIENLKTREKSSVRELAKNFDVSEITIRRDLQSLENQGLIARYHGGAIIKTSMPSFVGKQDKNLGTKKRIAQKASEFIEDGDKIFLDCGSTLLQLCPFLKKKRSLRVITNSIPAVLELEDFGNISVNLIGGEYDHERRAIHGAIATRHIELYKADKAFIGADGVSLTKGLTSHSETEMTNSRTMAKMATEVFVLADSSKIEKEAHVKMLDWKSIDFLITDNKISREFLKNYEAAGISIIMA